MFRIVKNVYLISNNHKAGVLMRFTFFSEDFCLVDVSKVTNSLHVPLDENKITSLEFFDNF